MTPGINPVLKFAILATAVAASLPLQLDYVLALEEDVFRTTVGSNAVFVRGHARHTLQCAELSPPKLSLIVAPEHGRVCFKDTKIEAMKDLHIGKDNKCIGRSLSGVKVYYEPDDRYVGADEFKYKVDGGYLAKVGNEAAHYRVRIIINAGDRPHTEDRSSTAQRERQPPGPIPPCSLLVS